MFSAVFTTVKACLRESDLHEAEVVSDQDLSGQPPAADQNPVQEPAPDPRDRPSPPAHGDTLFVPSEAYKTLWEGELRQQVVDGAYMNRITSPDRWSGLSAKVDLSRKVPVLVSGGATPLSGNFPFEQDVLPVVGNRMMALVQGVDRDATTEDLQRMCEEFHTALANPRTEE